MRVGSYLLVRRSDMRVDGWTYGDWRQYVAFLGGDVACCVRHSDIPSLLFMVGLVALTFPAMAAFMAFNGVEVPWTRVIWIAAVGGLLLVPALLQRFTGWRLVVVVGTVTKKDGDGWERDL